MLNVSKTTAEDSELRKTSQSAEVLGSDTLWGRFVQMYKK